MSGTRQHLGWLSGVGLVVTTMVGVGVLTSTGFMAAELSPGLILLAWLLGGLMALAGARSYGALAALIPRSGGEYRYIGELWHPALGYLAGWVTVVVGFAAPIAVSALVAGSFAQTLWPALEPRLAAVALIAVLAVAHALDLDWSRRAQGLLFAAEALLFIGFVGVGLLGGSHRVIIAPAVAHDGLGTFMKSLFYVAYSYSGWNAAAYVAGEFRDAERQVGRALVVGTLLVTTLYLVVNWVLLANLPPAQLDAWTRGDTARITLGHFVMANLAGPRAAAAMSVLVVLAMTASVSAMTFIGPRVASEMAAEGYLPRSFAARMGKPPALAAMALAALAILLLVTHSFDSLVRSIGAILTLASVLSVLGLLRRRRAARVPLVSAILFVTLGGYMLVYAVHDNPMLLAWASAVVLLVLVGYYATRRRHTP